MATPPFTAAKAYNRVKAAQVLWNTRDPDKVVKAYTADSVWRNRDKFMKGTSEIHDFLTWKWNKEKNYTLRKELFAFTENKIAVQFWYEYQDAHDDMKWKRCYGIEHWTFTDEGLNCKRQMSGNDVVLNENERWFKDGVDEDTVDIPEGHW